ADATRPFLTSAPVTSRLGKMVVSWTTEDPATTIVRFGTNGPQSLAVTNSVRDQIHEVELGNLVAGATYQFLIVSADEAGNVATNDNGGSLFSFVAVPAKTVLLVDAYVHGPDDDSTEIPVTVYTVAVDPTGGR